MTPKEALIHLAGIRGCESYFSKDQLTALDMAIAELEIKQQSIELLAKTFGVPESQAEEMLNLVGEKHVSDDGARQVIKRMLNLDAREEHFPDSTKMMGDCISRLAAISIPVMPKEHRKDDTYEGGWNDALACVNNLPSVQPDRKTFTVIDKTTGKEADTYKIALHEKWAKGLIYCDMEGFAIEEDGTLILLDECGRHEYCPEGRFEVVWDE